MKEEKYERNKENWIFIKTATKEEQAKWGYASPQTRGVYECKHCGRRKMFAKKSFKIHISTCGCILKKKEEEATGVWAKNLKNWEYIDFATLEEKESKGLRLKTTFKKYRCTTCGEIRFFASGVLKQNLKVCDNGCHGVGSGNVMVIKGINDMATTHPHLIDYCVNREDAFKHRAGSDKILEMRCPHCQYAKMMAPKTLGGFGFACPNCNDGLSYPEKFMQSLLRELSIDYYYQASNTVFGWCGKIRYDFYIPSFNLIIETHGKQHYKDSSWSTSNSQRSKDDRKRKMALENGIVHYIEVDCFKSDFDYIKNNVLSTELPNILDMCKVNWENVKVHSEKNIFIEVINFYNETKMSPPKIAKHFGLNRSTVNRYLKRGSKNGMCDYIPYKTNYSKKPVVVVNEQTKEIKYSFDSVSECAKMLDYSQHNISTIIKRDKPFVKSNKLGGTYGFYHLESEKWQSVKHLYDNPQNLKIA